MGFRTILTVLTDHSHLPQLDAATGLCHQHDAHLDVLCVGLDISQPGYYFPGGAPYVYQDGLANAETEADALKTAAMERLGQSDHRRWQTEAAVAQIGGLTSLVGRRARFADLAVLSQPYAEGAAGSTETIVEAALFEGDCPVLILPPDGLATTAFRQVLVAWNQSSEAMAAIRRSLPLLTRADRVQITVVDPAHAGLEGGEPGTALARMLTRHGVKAEIAVIALTAGSVAEQISQHALDTDADLIVMGAYGHSRFREAILGGATRDMLNSARLPVFMAR